MAHLVLHVWPGNWNLSSIDPQCLAAILYIQLNWPGSFEIVECTDPDLSPSGQLPFLVHDHQAISSFPLIIEYVTALAKCHGAEVNSPVPPANAENVAWCAHIESHLGDLVAHMFYAVEENWSKLTHPILASGLPIPQRYYVPGRLRDMWKPRLEASGLWPTFRSEDNEDNGPFKDIKKNDKYSRAFRSEDDEDKGPLKDIKKKDKYSRAFNREKVLEKARSAFDKYTRLLEQTFTLERHRPTLFDILLTAHLLLLLEPPFLNPSVQDLLTKKYPTLVSHALRVQARGTSTSFPQMLSRESYSWKSLIPRPLTGSSSEISKPKIEDDIRFDSMQWNWIILAVGATALCCTMAMKRH